MPPSLFVNWTLRVTYIETLLHGMILWGELYYMPLYYEACKGYTSITSGVALFPSTFTVAPACIVVGLVVTITGKYRWAVWSGWFLTILGTGLMYLLGPDTQIVKWIFINIVPGFGTGVLFPAMSFAIQASVDVKHIASAVAFYSFFRSFGQALGIAIGGSIFQNEMRRNILKYPLIAPMADEYSQDATALVTIIQIMEDGLAKTQLITAYADSLKIVWVVMCGLAGIGGFVSLWTKENSLDQLLVTNQGFDHGKKEKDTEMDTGKADHDNK